MAEPWHLDRAGTLEHLQTRLQGTRAAPRKADSGHSGVLVPIRLDPAGHTLVFTRRTEHLNAHPGEVSFPGGRLEVQDDGPREAALRETHEEIGLAPEDIVVGGLVTDYQPFRGPLIHAYAGLVEAKAPEPRRASPDEVAEILHVPVAGLLDPDPDPEGKVPAGQHWPSSYESRVWWDEDRGDRVVHYWYLDEETRIWGITGELVARFLSLVYGWVPPEAPDRIRELDGFIR